MVCVACGAESLERPPGCVRAEAENGHLIERPDGVQLECDVVPADEPIRVVDPGNVRKDVPPESGLELTVEPVSCSASCG